MAVFLTQVLGTVAVWALSGALAVGLALLLTSLSLRRSRLARAVGDTVTTVTRGVPTSLLVVSAGVMALPHATPDWLPHHFQVRHRGLP